MRFCRTVAVIVLFLGTAAKSSEAALIKTLEFNVDGVLPSAEPDIFLFNNTGQAESSLYSVSGGFLRQRTLPGGTEVVGNASYAFPSTAITGGGLSPTLNTVLEAEINVLDVTSSDAKNSGIGFQAFDGTNRYLAFLTPTGVSLSSSSGFVSVPFNVFGTHTYRIESPANSNEARLFIDGVFQQSWTALSTTNNGFTFGDGISAVGNAANADWNFVRLSQDVELTAVPEPHTILGLGLALGLGALSVKRKQKKCTE